MVRFPRVIATALLGCLLGLASPPLANSQTPGAPLGEPPRFDPSFAAWNAVLARCATPEGFRYDRLATELEPLDRQLLELGSVTAGEFSRFTREGQLAFLINAHNVHAVAIVMRRYPITSIEDTRLFGSALDRKEIHLLGKEWSLRSLRDEIMGAKFREARAIFLLNWGMRGCNPLPEIAITETNLKNMLDRQTRLFVSDSRYNRHEVKEIRFYASPLLKEYRKDIERDFTTLWAFVEKYSAPKTTAEMRERLPKFKFMGFDRLLNAAPEVALEAPALPAN